MTKHAINIFIITIGIAFSSAIYSLHALSTMSIQNKGIVITCYSIIFYFTLPRFFFGNLIFYKRTQEQVATKGSIKARLSTNLMDFYLCLAEFLLFFFVGTSIQETSTITIKPNVTQIIVNPYMFILGLLIISGVDVIWHGMVWYGTMRAPHTTKKPENSGASGSWAAINLVTGACCLLILCIEGPPLIELGILSAAYTGAFFVDFIYNREFYLEEWEKVSSSP